MLNLRQVRVSVLVMRKEAHQADTDPELHRAYLEWAAIREEVRLHLGQPSVTEVELSYAASTGLVSSLLHQQVSLAQLIHMMHQLPLTIHRLLYRR